MNDESTASERTAHVFSPTELQRLVRLLSTHRVKVTDEQAERAAFASDWSDYMDWCGKVGKRIQRKDYEALNELLTEFAAT